MKYTIEVHNSEELHVSYDGKHWMRYEPGTLFFNLDTFSYFRRVPKATKTLKSKKKRLTLEETLLEAKKKQGW